MPSYYYRARDGEGRSHEGVHTAASEDEVLRMLENSQLVPIAIEAQGATGGVAAGELAQIGERVSGAMRSWRGRVKPASVALFARQLATMVGAGLPMIRCLRSIARDHHDKRMGAILDRVADDVQKGEALSTALARHPGAFDEVFVSLVRTGEVSGTLEKILDQTAGYLERSEGLRLKVEAALRYPTFVLSFSALVLVAMIVKVIPMFTAIYERFRVPLPLPTRILLAVSTTVTENLPILSVLVLAAVLAGWNAARTEPGKLWLDRQKFALPVFGGLIRMYAVTKFARTLGILTRSGTQILYALRVMKPVPGNKVLEQGIDFIHHRVEQGSSLARAMSESGAFPEMLVQMTATGEETGQLDGMLTRTAEFYEQRVNASVDGLSSLVEPIAILVLGTMVALMLLALYLPIFSLGQAMRSGMMGQ